MIPKETRTYIGAILIKYSRGAWLDRDNTFLNLCVNEILNYDLPLPEQESGDPKTLPEIAKGFKDMAESFDMKAHQQNAAIFEMRRWLEEKIKGLHWQDSSGHVYYNEVLNKVVELIINSGE